MTPSPRMQQEYIRRARAVNIAAHSAVSQTRKYNGVPYYRHPEAVAKAVAKFYSDYAMICAAYMHDVIEDTGMTLTELSLLFPEVVVSYVYWLSDISKKEDGNREVRKKIDLAHIAKAPGPVQTVKCFDLIDNTSSISLYDPNFAVNYLREKAAVLAVLDRADLKALNMAHAALVRAEKSLHDAGYSQWLKEKSKT